MARTDRLKAGIGLLLGTPACLLGASVILAMTEQWVRQPHALAAGTAQTATSDLPVVVDGSRHPELIPDDYATHLVMLAASASSADKEIDRARAKAVVDNILRHAAADLFALEQIANDYRASYGAFAVTNASADENQFTAGRREMVSTALRNVDANLSAEAATALRQYIQQEKSQMRLIGAPRMNQARNWFDRVLFIQPVWAQMSGGPSGGVYHNTSRNYSTLYVTGVTDTAASCSCHSASVSVRIVAPSASTSSSSGLGPAAVQTTASYTLRSSDFVDGQIAVTSTHFAHCPIANVNFINNVTIPEWVPLNHVTAYYRAVNSSLITRCNPTGGVCDNCMEFGSTNAAYGLFDGIEMSIKAVEACIMRIVSVETKCKSPDPNP